MTRLTKRLLAVVLTAGVLTGCQTRPPPLPEHAPGEHSLDVMFHAQERYQCGPAALAMALNAAGRTVAPETLVGEVWLPGREGSLLLELRAAARARERLVYPVATPDALVAQLQAGQPVLIMQNLAFGFWPQWHFAVVTGYTDNGERMILHTGTQKADRQHWNRFIRTWARADYQGFVVLPPGQLPARAEPVQLVQALAELRDTAGAEASRPYWPAAVSRWPNEYIVQFGWGNRQWQRGEQEKAIRAFQKAVDIDPDAASAWNNLAEAWRQTGCPARARHAINKALDRETDQETLRDTRKRIEQMPETICPIP